MRYDLWRCVMWCDVMWWDVIRCDEMRCDEIWVCLLLLSAITAGVYWSLPHNVLRVITVNRRRQYEIWFMKMCDVMRWDVMRCDVMRCDEMWWDVMRCDEMWWNEMRCDEMWVCLLLLSAITAGIYWSLPHNVLRVITVNRRRQYVIWSIWVEWLY